MPNPLKGEIDLDIGGENYKARLTIDAIIRIEQAIGCGIIKLAQRMADADISVTDVTSVLTAALRGGGNDVTTKEVHKIITNAGIIEATTAVATLLTAAISPTDDSDEGSKKKGS